MYYDALIAKWPEAPAGTTEEKLAWINAETVPGPPVPMIVPTHQIYNRIDRGEFNALDPTAQQSVRDILSMGTIDISPNTEMRAHLISIFPSGSQSYANLSAYAQGFDAPPMPWWQASVENGGGGLSSLVTHPDLEVAGLS